MRSNPLKAKLKLLDMTTWDLRREILEAQGWGKKIPTNTQEIFLNGVHEIKGFKYFVLNSGTKGRSSPHRIMLVCDCGRQIPLGRTTQHVCNSPLPPEYIVLIMDKASERNLTELSGGKACFIHHTKSYPEQRLS